MGLGSSCRSLGAAEEEEEEGCVGGGIASASRGLLPGETSRTGGPAFGSNLKVLALQGEDVDGHGGPRLNRVLRHLKGNVLVAVIAHVNPERVLLVLASEEEEKGDRSTSASSPSGVLRRPFLPGSPPKPGPDHRRCRSRGGEARPYLGGNLLGPLVPLSFRRWGRHGSPSQSLLSSQSGSPSLASCLPAARPKAYGLPARTDLLRVPQRTSSSGRNSFSLWGVAKMCFVHAPFCPRIDTGIRQIETGQLCEPRAVEKPSQFLMRDVTMANTSKMNERPPSHRNCQSAGGGRRRSSSKRKGRGVHAPLDQGADMKDKKKVRREAGRQAGVEAHKATQDTRRLSLRAS